MKMCSYCTKEIKSRLSGMDYFLKLSAEVVYPEDAIADYMLVPPIDGDKYFCGFKCLNGYINIIL